MCVSLLIRVGSFFYLASGPCRSFAEPWIKMSESSENPMIIIVIISYLPFIFYFLQPRRPLLRFFWSKEFDTRKGSTLLSEKGGLSKLGHLFFDVQRGRARRAGPIWWIGYGDRLMRACCFPPSRLPFLVTPSFGSREETLSTIKDEGAQLDSVLIVATVDWNTKRDGGACLGNDGHDLASGSYGRGASRLDIGRHLDHVEWANLKMTAISSDDYFDNLLPNSLSLCENEIGNKQVVIYINCTI